MNVVIALVPVLAQLVILAGTLYAIRASQPKSYAEAQHQQAEANVDIANAYSQLLAATQQQVQEYRTRWIAAQDQATIVPVLTKRIESLEDELRRANRTIATYRDAILKAQKKEPNGQTVAT